MRCNCDYPIWLTDMSVNGISGARGARGKSADAVGSTLQKPHVIIAFPLKVSSFL